MNKIINELVQYLPINLKTKKLDKITALKATVQYMRTLTGLLFSNFIYRLIGMKLIESNRFQ
jgi:hypothetical protein